MSFLNTDMAQVVDILPSVRQECIYSTKSMPCVLVSLQSKAPGYQ